MLLVRTGGRFGVLVALIVAGVFMFVVRPAINDTTERAFDAAGRSRTSTNAGGDALSAAAFGAAVRDVRADLVGGAELLDFTVTNDGGSVKYRTGDRAAGLTWGPGRDGLEPVDVTLVGSGKLEDNVFPIAKLSPGAGARLAAAVKAKAGDGADLQTMALGLAPVTGAVRWTVTADDRGRALVFTAKPDASGLRAVD